MEFNSIEIILLLETNLNKIMYNEGMSMAKTIQGMFFDFDGIILETEGPIFQSLQEIYNSFGYELTLNDWAKVIGLSPKEHDQFCDLEALASDGFDRANLEIRFARREQELILEQDILPGIEDYINAAKERSLKLAIVSSSSREWVHGHLERLGLLSYFDITCCADDVMHAKPDPALYVLALEKLNLYPHQVIVLEDSPNGVLAAKRAELFCVAVPTEMTKQLSLDMADLKINSLADVPLDELLDHVQDR